MTVCTDNSHWNSHQKDKWIFEDWHWRLFVVFNKWRAFSRSLSRQAKLYLTFFKSSLNRLIVAAQCFRFNYCFTCEMFWRFNQLLLFLQIFCSQLRNVGRLSMLNVIEDALLLETWKNIRYSAVTCAIVTVHSFVQCRCWSLLPAGIITFQTDEYSILSALVDLSVC